jgi:hypothetical protein
MSRDLFTLLSLLNCAFVVICIPGFIPAAAVGITIELVLAWIAQRSNGGKCFYK